MGQSTGWMSSGFLSNMKCLFVLLTSNREKREAADNRTLGNTRNFKQFSMLLLAHYVICDGGSNTASQLASSHHHYFAITMIIFYPSFFFILNKLTAFIYKIKDYAN